MPLGRTASVYVLSASILGAALIIALGPNNQSFRSSSEGFDFATIRSAEAASTNSLFLKVDGMPGSSTNTNHKDEIELLWYCFGFSSRTDSPGCYAAAGRNVFDITDFDGFHFEMADNKATPKLLTAYLSNSTINTVTFSAQSGSLLGGGGGGSDYLVVTLSDVKVTSYFHLADEDYRMPIVQSSLSFSKIQMHYKGDGPTVSAGWDFTTHKPL